MHKSKAWCCKWTWRGNVMMMMMVLVTFRMPRNQFHQHFIWATCGYKILEVFWHTVFGTNENNAKYCNLHVFFNSYNVIMYWNFSINVGETAFSFLPVLEHRIRRRRRIFFWIWFNCFKARSHKLSRCNDPLPSIEDNEQVDLCGHHQNRLIG